MRIKVLKTKIAHREHFDGRKGYHFQSYLMLMLVELLANTRL